MRAVEDRDRFRSRQFAPVRIRARHVSDQRAVRLAAGDEQERHVRDQRLGRDRREERRERMVVHQPRERRAVGHLEMRRGIDAHRRRHARDSGIV
jgi:hypothetical protein